MREGSLQEDYGDFHRARKFRRNFDFHRPHLNVYVVKSLKLGEGWIITMHLCHKTHELIMKK